LQLPQHPDGAENYGGDLETSAWLNLRALFALLLAAMFPQRALEKWLPRFPSALFRASLGILLS
jgi:hypothetical protein